MPWSARKRDRADRVAILDMPAGQLGCVVLCGGFGGLLNLLWRLHQQPGGDSDSHGFAAFDLFAHGLLGAGAGLVFVFIILSVDRQNLMRLYIYAMIGGYACFQVWDSASQMVSAALQQTEVREPTGDKKWLERFELHETTAPASLEPDSADAAWLRMGQARNATDLARVLAPEAREILQVLSESVPEREWDSLRRSPTFDASLVSLETLNLISPRDPSQNPPSLTERGTRVAHLFEPPQVSLPFVSYPAQRIASLQVGAPADGSFEEFADQWYRVDTERDTIYEIATTSSDDTDTLDADTELFLFDADLDLIGHDDDFGEGTFSLLREDLAAGRYFVRVSSYDRTSGDFRVTFSVQDAATPMQLATENAIDMTIGQSRDSEFSDSERHLYVFALEEQGAYTIRTASRNGAAVDTEIELFDDRGVLLGYDDDGSAEPLYSELSECLREGRFYVRVSSYFGLPGAYRVSVNEDRDGSRC